MKIATWNVNSIRQRQALVEKWLKSHKPDVLMLQEIKCETDQFPKECFESLGYSCAVVGQKSYNGVATLIRGSYDITCTTLPGFAHPAGHDAARYIEIRIRHMILGNLYLPNGNSGGEAGYAIKLAFCEALISHAHQLLTEETDFILAGDYNICPSEDDYATDALSPHDALIRPQSRAAWHQLRWLGLTDALRALHPTGAFYTFWDYQNRAWERNSGLRIDHMLLSPRLAERLIYADPDISERAMERPSDHVPFVIHLKE